MKPVRLNIFLFGSFLCMAVIIGGCARYHGEIDQKEGLVNVKEAFRFIPPGKTILTAGLLADRCNKNISNLYLTIDPGELKKIYSETHDSWYAEPEFLGHWLTAGPLLYAVSGNEEIKKRNRDVLEAVLEAQRQDGYLGSYHRGLEFDHTFSVWNQNFIIKGLIAQYEATGNQKALNAATKCADYIANAFLKSDTLDLLFGLNQGIQHATILEEMAHLYRITGKKPYLDFANYIIDRLENSSIQVISIPNQVEFWAINFMMGSTKGIEMFNIYFGILEMYRITGEKKYLSAAHNYWKNLQAMQIRITGNGTIGENWSHLGNTPIDLTNDMRPNENCVAMGWMKFNAELALFNGEAKYFDELEKTLYNHLIGSQAIDGHDFSYYQGNIGHKVHEKDPGAYSCCRYRGMRILSYLPGYVYMQSDDQVAVNLYTTSTTEAEIKDVPVSIEMKTNYPKSGHVLVEIIPERDIEFVLLLRKPGWCEKATLQVNGDPLIPDQENGYLVIRNVWPSSGSSIVLDLDLKIEFIRADINEEPRVAVKYGPLVLAIDSRYGTPIGSTRIRVQENPMLEFISVPEENDIPQVLFKTAGKINGKEDQITLVDYASAGSIHAGVDEFRVWVPAFE
jgi:DUF1680 family protein